MSAGEQVVSNLGRTVSAGRWCWVCIKDPDGAFRGNHFSIEMVRAGGFEDGTVFRNKNTGECKAWRNGKLVIESDKP